MVANPKPLNAIRDWDAERPVVYANSDASIATITYMFEVQRLMRRILPEQSEVLARKLLDVRGKSVETSPEAT